MIDQKTILCIIPGRGGSKGVKNKNIRLCGNKPLIAWTIEQARASKYIDRIVVSTDSASIAKVARRYGAETPFLRPREFAADRSAMAGVITHALGALKQTYDIILLLQPTSPLRCPADIDNVLISLSRQRSARAIVSVTAAEHHPYLCKRLPGDLCMKNFISKTVAAKNRQELPQFYRLNGALYAAYRDYFLKHNNFFGDKTFAYIMPADRSVDIDSMLDFRFASYLLAGHGGRKRR